MNKSIPEHILKTIISNSRNLKPKLQLIHCLLCARRVRVVQIRKLVALSSGNEVSPRRCERPRYAQIAKRAKKVRSPRRSAAKNAKERNAENALGVTQFHTQALCQVRLKMELNLTDGLCLISFNQLI